MKAIYISILLILLNLNYISAQNVLNLEVCRNLALKNNKELKISNEEIKISELEKKSARTNYYPKVSGLATYLRTQGDVSLLSENQKYRLQNIGSGLGQKLLPSAELLAKQYPQLAPIIEDFGPIFKNKIIPSLNETGSRLTDALDHDTRNLFIGALSVKQPIYVGGKIRAYNNITEYKNEIAQSKNNLERQEVILKTDEAYWRVVSLSNKKRLADSYVELLTKMENDVDKMIEQGVATRADGLSVKVKVNEAEMKQTKASNGESLAKMALAQICGLPLDAPIILIEEGQENLIINQNPIVVNEQSALENRPEIKALSFATLAKREKIKIDRSEYLPKIALTGNYLVTNPSAKDGIENKFAGTWSVGVQMSVPIWNWNEGRYETEIARVEAEISDYELEEAKEKIILEINQNNFKVNEAQKKLAMAEKNIEKAEENLRYARLGFREGVIPPSRVLEAHTAWFDAQSEKIDAQIEVKLSLVSLKKALGTLTINNLN